MSKRIRVKNKIGVFYREGAGGRVYYYDFKAKNGRKVEKKVGSRSNGFTVNMCVEARALAIREDVLGAGSKFITKDKKKITLDTLAVEYFATKSENRAIEMVKRQYENNLSFLGNIPLTELSEKHIEKLYESLQHLAIKTQSTQLNLLHAILEFGTHKKYLSQNPVKLWKIENERKNPTSKIDNSSERYFREHEIEQFFETIENDGTSEDVKLFYFIAKFTGARAGAILKIKWRDVGEKTIAIWDEKRQVPKQYHVPIHPKLQEKLDSMAPSNPNQAIVKSTYPTIRHHSSAIIEELGFNEDLDFKTDRRHWASLHTWRHTFGTNLAIAGVSIYIIQKLMNHKDILTTMRYAKFNTKENGADAIGKLS